MAVVIDGQTQKVHKGSWFGLPDFGITEGIGDLFNRPTTEQSGSNVIGGSSQPSVVTTQPTTVSGYQQLPVGVAPPTQGVSISNPQPQAQAPQTVSQGNLVSIFPGYAGWDSNSAWQDYLATGGQGKGGGNNSGGVDYSGIQNQISSGWDSYLSELDSILNNNLPDQQQSQIGIANTQRQNSLSSLDTQKALGLSDLMAEENKVGQRQVKTLRDLSGNIKNLMTAGNTYLGSMGAGDSSASNQYSFALNKMATQQRSDVMNQSAQSYDEISSRKFKLSALYDQGVKDIESDYSEKISSISQWFSEQQTALKMQKAQGQLNKSTDLASLSSKILDQALQALQTSKQEASNRRSMLEQWAIGNSANIDQLSKNLAGISNYQSPNYSVPQINPTMRVNSNGQAFIPNS